MKIGYVRASTTDQNTARQDVLMESLGEEEIYIDRVTGRRGRGGGWWWLKTTSTVVLCKGRTDQS